MLVPQLLAGKEELGEMRLRLEQGLENGAEGMPGEVAKILHRFVEVAPGDGRVGSVVMGVLLEILPVGAPQGIENVPAALALSLATRQFDFIRSHRRPRPLVRAGLGQPKTQ